MVYRGLDSRDNSGNLFVYLCGAAAAVFFGEEAMTDATQQFLQHWLDSDEAEAPVLLTGADEAKLKRAVEKMAEREDVEVVRIAAEKPAISINELREVFYNIARTTLGS